MPDITMCEGKDCPFKETCYRYLAEPSEHRQSWFTNPPYGKEKENECIYYWEHLSQNNNNMKKLLTFVLILASVQAYGQSKLTVINDEIPDKGGMLFSDSALKNLSTDIAIFRSIKWEQAPITKYAIYYPDGNVDHLFINGTDSCKLHADSITLIKYLLELLEKRRY